MNPKVLIMVAGVTTLTCYLASNCINVRIFESLTNGKSDNECYNSIYSCIKVVIASHTIVILTMLVPSFPYIDHESLLYMNRK